MITAKDRHKIEELVGEIVNVHLEEKFNVFDSCETDKDFDKAEQRANELLDLLISRLSARLAAHGFTFDGSFFMNEDGKSLMAK
jgi:hypothetical protein